MIKSLKNLTSKKSLLALFASLALTSYLPAHAFKVAVVDMDFILSNFSLVRDSYETIASSKTRLETLIQTADQEISELRKAGDQAKVDKRYKDIQLVLDKEVIKHHNNQIDIKKAIERVIEQEMTKLAKTNGLDLILDRSVAVGQGSDLTKAFLSQLEKTRKK